MKFASDLHQIIQECICENVAYGPSQICNNPYHIEISLLVHITHKFLHFLFDFCRHEGLGDIRPPSVTEK